jgi:protein-L-isoaspartate(D-aspartate) O-methyltransferase
MGTRGVYGLGNIPMRLILNKRHWALALLLMAGCAGAVYAAERDFAVERAAMVSSLRQRGIRDARVLAAMAKVPRHVFVPQRQRSRAYADTELATAEGEVLSSPHLVALMAESLALRPDMKVLEVGTDSGYQTALLAEMGARVYTVERRSELANLASARLRALGYRNVQFGIGEEAKGWPRHAPYDAILVTGGVDQIPDELLRQLAPEGCLVAPVGHGPEQTLDRMRKVGGRVRIEAMAPIRLSSSLGRPAPHAPPGPPGRRRGGRARR